MGSFNGVLPILSLVFNILLILFFVGKRYYYSYGGGKGKHSTWSDPWNKIRVDVHHTLPINSKDIIFVGDSQIEGFPVQEMFPRASVKNRGIGANLSNQVLARIENIARHTPKKIFLQFGINDLITNVEESTLLENYRLVIQKIKELSPGTEIFVQSLLPVCGGYSHIQPRVLMFNIKLAELCLRSNINYSDVHSRLFNENGLDPSMTEDGLHLNGKGYNIWKEEIKDLVQERRTENIPGGVLANEGRDQ